MSIAPTRPILRYHGGKWKLAPWIISHFPKHRVYVEPLGGAASVLLRKPRSYAEVYNDLDSELVNLFKIVRDRGDELIRTLHLTPFSRDEFKLSYQPSDCPLEQARRTVVRSMLGFGSNSHAKQTGFRNNSNRSRTTPAHDFTNYPDALNYIIERIRGVVIENRHYKLITPQHDSRTTLHYIDPPYVGSTRTPGNDYNHEMTDRDHVELAEHLHTLKGMVIVSGYDCLMYEELYAGWRTERIAALADGAAKRTETLWFSPNTPPTTTKTTESKF